MRDMPRSSKSRQMSVYQSSADGLRNDQYLLINIEEGMI